MYSLHIEVNALRNVRRSVECAFVYERQNYTQLLASDVKEIRQVRLFSSTSSNKLLV